MNDAVETYPIQQDRDGVNRTYVTVVVVNEMLLTSAERERK